MTERGILSTPIGPACVTWSDRGVSSVDRFDPIEHDAVGPLPSELAAALERQLKTGEPSHVQLDLSACSPLLRTVMEAMTAIPFGHTRAYGWVAEHAGNARAVRAVASAVGRNPIPLVVPCHRVVRADGAVGKFGWGRATKLALLRFEGVELSGDGERWLGKHT